MRTLCSISAVLLHAGVVALLIPLPASAQIRFLPGSEFDHINVHRPQSVSLRLEALQRSNDFERVASFREDSRLRQVALPVGRLKMRMEDQQGRKGTALCTASLISSEYLITNYHCLPGLVGLKVLSAKLEMDYLDEREVGRVRSFEVDVDPIEANEELDYAVSRVHGHPARTYGTVRFSVHGPQVQEAVFIVHHPEGAPKTISRKDCHVTVTSAREFIHSCDTLEGSSGSPVFSEESFTMVGLHYAGSAEGNRGKNIGALLHSSPILESLVVVDKNSESEPGPPVPAKPSIVLLRTTIALESDPSGASILYNGALIGATPHTFTVAGEEGFRFEIRKSGFEAESVDVPSVGGTIHRTVLLNRTPTEPVQPAAVPPLEPARQQVKTALAFWRTMEEQPPSEQGNASQLPGGRAEHQTRQATELLKALKQGTSR